jgi:RNA polymerase sigma-70 factor (ECF subfamily)
MAYLRLVRSASAKPSPVEEDACVAAFDRELDYIFETLRRLGAKPGEVEDLAHDVFVVLHRNWSSLDLERPLRPYLFGVAFRIVSANRRRRSRELPYAVPDIEDRAPGADRVLESQQSVELLLAGLERVPLPRRAVIILHELDGVPIVDVARTPGITRFGAYARLHKGLKELAAAVRRLQQRGTPG